MGAIRGQMARPGSDPLSSLPAPPTAAMPTAPRHANGTEATEACGAGPSSAHPMEGQQTQTMLKNVITTCAKRMNLSGTGWIPFPHAFARVDSVT